MLFRVNQHPFKREATQVAPALPCGNALHYAKPRGFELALVGRCVS